MPNAELAPASGERAYAVPVQSFADGFVGPRFGIRSQQVAAGNRRLHRHDYFEILFFASNGAEQRIYLRDYESRRGSIFFVSPMTPHQLRFSPDDRCFVIYFDLAYLRPELAGHAQMTSELLRRAPELAPFVYQGHLDFEFTEAQIELLQSLCDRMLREQDAPRLCSHEVIRANLSLLLTEVTHSYEGQMRALMLERPPMGGGERHVSRVLEFIEKRLAERVTLAQAAEAAAVTPNYLANLLRRETGQTFVDLLTARRMDRACELLAFTKQRVSQVGYAVGYFDVDYFCRRFKQVVGTTPLEYRAEHSLLKTVE